MASITVTIVNEEGLEEQITFPAKNKVCPECVGEGFVLREGMRGAYTVEEFDEAFCDDEDREAYFTRGGKYDQVCPCCKGKNVVAVPDVSRMTAEQKLQFQQWEKDQAQRARYEAEDRLTMRRECGIWD